MFHALDAVPQVIDRLVSSTEVVAFAANLAVGALAIYLGARVVLHDEDESHGSLDTAFVTALAGAVVVTLLATVPYVGAVLALAGWIAVLHWRYPTDWPDTVVVGALAWLAAVVSLTVLSLLGVDALSALGVPWTGVDVNSLPAPSR